MGGLGLVTDLRQWSKPFGRSEDTFVQGLVIFWQMFTDSEMDTRIFLSIVRFQIISFMDSCKIRSYLKKSKQICRYLCIQLQWKMLHTMGNVSKVLQGKKKQQPYHEDKRWKEMKREEIKKKQQIKNGNRSNSLFCREFAWEINSMFLDPRNLF